MIKNSIQTKSPKNKIWLFIVTTIFSLASCSHTRKNLIQNKNLQENNSLEKNSVESEKSCNTNCNLQKNKNVKKNKEQHVITIWIHGTKAIGLQDHVFKDFFFRLIGLHNIHEYQEKHKIKKIAKKLSDQNTEKFVFDNFYTFGWSGYLSHKSRKIAAKDLHKAIFELVQEYDKKSGVKPKIRLITHSHGGNVALNMAKINNKSQNKISIYEAIFLACPVQQKTSKYVSDKIFEKIYSLYSETDMIQVIDPQGLHKFKNKEEKPLFSERRFKDEGKIIQSKLKLNGHGLMHVHFITEKFASALPFVLDELDSWDKEEKGEKFIKIKTGKNFCIERRYSK